jgi:hypothetical protein
VTSNDTTWVRIIRDNKDTLGFRIFPHGQKNIKAANSFHLTIGNSRSVQLTLNEKPLSFSSQGRRVSNFTVDTAGVHYLNPPLLKNRTP